MYKNLLLLLLIAGACGGPEGTRPTAARALPERKMDGRYNQLTPAEEEIILRKGTERPFTGKYVTHKDKGLYLCRRCDAPLYRSEDKFASDCGWPSFDDEIAGAVKRTPDADGRRTEITCSRCGGHLGHVFAGEGFTAKDTRHCVNSLSMDFLPADRIGRAIFASGCFWGTEYHFAKAPGVLSAVSGYIGGSVKNPTYDQVCSGTTGMAEAVEVTYDKKRTNYETLCRLFFETHDPTQVDRQGPDVGSQYRSELFWLDARQKSVAEKLIDLLKQRGLKVATRLTKAPTFWPAEGYHQDYYQRKGGVPYCHRFTKRF